MKRINNPSVATRQLPLHKGAEYETPEILLVLEGENDIITTSGGDMPLVDAFDW